MVTRVDAITVCVDYDDFLALTLPRYLEIFERVVVVSVARDEATRALCARAGVACALSERIRYRGLEFNLAALANDGYRALAPTGWVCKIDPDIALPADARTQLAECLDDPELLWGTRRSFCASRARFEAFEQSRDLSLLDPPYERGPDILGFLQLWNVGASAVRHRNVPYEEEHYEPPSHTNDRIFSAQWPVEQRRQLPFDVVHLGIDAIGKNWKGRRSVRFA